MNRRSPIILLFFILTSLCSLAQTEVRKDSAINDDDSLGVFEKVDIEASFPGGDIAWIKFLQHNLRGDVPAENGAPAGIYTVWVQFIVDRQGLMTDLKALTDIGYGMEKEVLRLIKISPQWQPAIQNGRPVKSL